MVSGRRILVDCLRLLGRHRFSSFVPPPTFAGWYGHRQHTRSTSSYIETRRVVSTAKVLGKTTVLHRCSYRLTWLRSIVSWQQSSLQYCLLQKSALCVVDQPGAWSIVLGSGIDIHVLVDCLVLTTGISVRCLFARYVSSDRFLPVAERQQTTRPPSSIQAAPRLTQSPAPKFIPGRPRVKLPSSHASRTQQPEMLEPENL
jgi:hypothetical protein